MIVVKFGGSSLAGPERMLAAARIVAQHNRAEPVVCVVSAMAGVTDKLFAIARLAARGDFAWRGLYAPLRDQHVQTLESLAPTGDSTSMTLAPLWRALETDAASLASIRNVSEREEVIAVFSAWGERLSVRL